MIEELLKLAKGALQAISMTHMPHELPAAYSVEHPRAGQRAGRYLLQVNDDGARYAFEADPNPEPSRWNQRPQAVSTHRFERTEDLFACCRLMLKGDPGREAEAGDYVGFLSVRGQVGAALRVFQLRCPEAGQMLGHIQRHPSFDAWRQFEGAGRELSHVAFAELLMDYRDTLVQPQLASLISQFRAVKKIEYDADLETPGTFGVKTTFGAKGATANADIPKEFQILTPAWLGPWPRGEEPRFGGTIRVRMNPPKGNDVAPTFLVRWIDIQNTHMEADAALLEGLRGQWPSLPIFIGAPESETFSVPPTVRP